VRRTPGGPQRWQRVNHRGRPVTLLAGPALTVAATATCELPPAAAVLAGLGSGVAGAYDDVAGARPAQARAKGVRGHLSALRRGQVTGGAVKVAGIGLAGLAAAATRPGARPPGDVLLNGAVVAGAANLVNLLDLRPGRALKAGLLGAGALGQPGPAGAVLALLPGDLAERAMLGDAGANALGALLGLALVERVGSRAGRAAALAVLAGLTAASEVVSFTAVINAVPPLRALDRLGRLP
jgi:UDP-N-acetylmuramyl pentapeptide phosphotransferase/UDP-N-acetylglucosamine-1-phosphate transferase